MSKPGLSPDTELFQSLGLLVDDTTCQVERLQRDIREQQISLLRRHIGMSVRILAAYELKEERGVTDRSNSVGVLAHAIARDGLVGILGLGGERQILHEVDYYDADNGITIRSTQLPVASIRATGVFDPSNYDRHNMSRIYDGEPSGVLTTPVDELDEVAFAFASSSYTELGLYLSPYGLRGTTPRIVSAEIDYARMAIRHQVDAVKAGA